MLTTPFASRRTVTLVPSPGIWIAPSCWGRARIVTAPTMPVTTPATTTRTTSRMRSSRPTILTTSSTLQLPAAVAKSAGRGDAPSRREDRAQAQLDGPVEDRRPEHEIGQTDAEVADDDTAVRRTLRARDDRLADRRGRVRVAVEVARVAVREELLALVDEEEGRPRRDLRGAVRRVVDGDDERVGRQPVVGHHLPDGPERRGGDDDIGVADGVPGRRGHGRADDAVGRPGRLRERRRPLGVAIEHGQIRAE